MGGVDLIGAKVAAQASARNAILSKGCFIAVHPFPLCPRLAAFFPNRLYQALVSASLRLVRPMEHSFRHSLADETSSGDREGNPILTGRLDSPCAEANGADGQFGRERRSGNERPQR
jgi:hypothetical protein